jgi:hypothetical protein
MRRIPNPVFPYIRNEQPGEDDKENYRKMAGVSGRERGRCDDGSIFLHEGPEKDSKI